MLWFKYCLMMCQHLLIWPKRMALVSLSAIGQAKTTPAGGAGLDVLSITTPSQTLSFTRSELQNSGQKLAMPSKVCVIIQSVPIKSLL